MQAPALVISQFAPAEACVIESSVPGGHGGGDGGDGGAGDAQITKPPLPEAKIEVDHVIVSPAAITTLLGPLVPEYRVPPILT